LTNKITSAQRLIKTAAVVYKTKYYLDIATR